MKSKTRFGTESVVQWHYTSGHTISDDRFMKRKQTYLGIVAAILLHGAISKAEGSERVAPDLNDFVELTTPEHPGPHPIAALMPGCMGWHPHHQLWRKNLLREGFAILEIDSFGANGLSDPIDLRRYVCSGLRVRWDQRARDLNNILKDIIKRPDISLEGGVIFGWSHGASSSLEYILGGASSDSSHSDLNSFVFDVAFLFYPYCGPGTIRNAKGQVRSLGIMLFHGSEDRITDPIECRRRANHLKKRGVSIDFITLDGSGHWFDNHAEPRTYKPNTTREVTSIINKRLKAQPKIFEK